MSPLSDWNAQLIRPEEALAIAGDWPVVFAVMHNSDANTGEIHMCCEDCGQSVAMLNRGDAEYRSSVEGQLSAVLRHMVMAHDIPLNHRRENGRGNADRAGPGRPAADDLAGGDRRRGRRGAAGH
jgi:hypothetical protein